MNRYMREVLRVHVERHFLGWFIRPDRSDVTTTEVAEALIPVDRIRAGGICYCAGVGEDTLCSAPSGRERGDLDAVRQGIIQRVEMPDLID